GCRAAAPLHPSIFPDGFSNIPQLCAARLTGVRFVFRSGNGTHSMPKLSSSHIVKHGYKGRLVDIAQALRCGLSQREPVMPTAQRVLQPFQFRQELSGRRRFRRKLGRLARALHDQAITMKRLFVDRSLWNGYALEHLPADRQWVEARIESHRLLGSSQPLAQPSNILLLHYLVEPSLMSCAKFNEGLHQLCLAPRFLRDF